VTAAMPGGRHGAPEEPGREQPSAGAAVAERTRARGAPVDPGRPAGGLRPAALSLGAAWLIRGLRSTVRLRHHGDARLRGWEERGEHFILAFWHRHLLLMPYAYRGRRISVLISRSRDGELIAFHDAVAGGVPVSGLTRDEIEAAAGVRPPLLAEVLRVCAGRIRLDVELKEDGYVTDVMTVLRAGFDPAQLVGRDAAQPPGPERAERLVGRPGQRRVAARGEFEPGAG